MLLLVVTQSNRMTGRYRHTRTDSYSLVDSVNLNPSQLSVVSNVQINDRNDRYKDCRVAVRERELETRKGQDVTSTGGPNTRSDLEWYFLSTKECSGAALTRDLAGRKDID